MSESEEKIVSKRLARPPWLSVVGLALLVLLIGAGIFLSHGWKMELSARRLLVVGHRIVTPDDIVKASKVLTGARLYAMDLRTVEKNILSHPYIKWARVTRRLPDALRIEVGEREPIGALSVRHMTYFDEEGVALPPYQPAGVFDVPLISGGELQNDPEPGRRVDEAWVLRGVGILNQARALGPDVYHLISEVHLVPAGNVVFYSMDAGVPVVLGKDVDSRKLLMFETFWKEFVPARGSDQLQIVDLRFKDQIVARWRTPAEQVPGRSPTDTSALIGEIHQTKF
jgi:cell division protein FtsQ